jgi:RNA polymerase sigma-70 factor, ECF subfamily
MRIRAESSREKILRALYDQHAPVLLAYALRLTDGDRARAEDIVQETLLRAWQNLELLDDTVRPVRPWLFTVAQHLAIDAHRARRARPHEVGDAALDAVPGLDDLEQALDRILVTDALQALSQEHRAVIVET